MFPSPLGVIFSLIFIKMIADANIAGSFRLLSELYSLLFIALLGTNQITMPVSVSSRSYILSYLSVAT